MFRRSTSGPASLVALTVGLTACAPRAVTTPERRLAPAVSVAAASVDPNAPEPAAISDDAIEMDRSWHGFGVPNCSYLAPKGDFIAEDGGVDVVFHFHAGQMSEREIRASGVRGVFVSCGYGVGTTGYARAFADRGRFGWMMKRLLRRVGASAHSGDVHLRHLALVSWSAGYAAVSRILSVPEWYAATDAVVLLDSLHAGYVDARGARRPGNVNTRTLEHFIRFAADAVDGDKTMVITHSAIVPPDYASTTEATAALLAELGVAVHPTTETNGRGMSLATKVDDGGLHVRGFRGMGPRDHFDHLHLIDVTLRSWVVPRWYTRPGE